MKLIPDSLRRPPRDPEGTMTLVEHLEELRGRLFISLGAIGVGSVIGWFLYGPVLRLLQDPYCATIRNLPRGNRPPTGCKFVFTGVMEPVVIKLKVVVFLGLFFALPIVLWQLWAFVVPGLTRRERRLAVPFVASSVVLFALGAVIAYFTLPKGLGFLLGFAGSGFVPLLTGDRFLGFVMLLALAFGLSFEFPVVLVFLSLVGVISSQKMREWRRGAILFIAIFAAVITPSSDPYTMTAMMVPMILFYEGAIIVARLMNR
jgi:sec-independent protein translocase protein TatC